MADTRNYSTQILSFDHDLLSEVEWMSAENARLRAQRPQPSDMREGVCPDADGLHLVWWPDELPVPLFTGKTGSRNLVVLYDPSIHYRDPSVYYVGGAGADMAQNQPIVGNESIQALLSDFLRYQRYVISALIGKPVAADDQAPMKGSVPGQDNAVTKRVNDVIDDLAARRVVGESRKDLRKALDAADKPETGPLPGGVHRAPEGLGRALGSTRYPFGIGGRSS